MKGVRRFQSCYGAKASDLIPNRASGWNQVQVACVQNGSQLHCKSGIAFSNWFDQDFRNYQFTADNEAFACLNSSPQGV